jgi:hypothetical protein
MPRSGLVDGNSLHEEDDHVLGGLWMAGDLPIRGLQLIFLDYGQAPATWDQEEYGRSFSLPIGRGQATG